MRTVTPRAQVRMGALDLIGGREAAWMADAVCAGRLDWTERPIDAQLADCRVCPVRAQCAEFAADTSAVGVVMGGRLWGEPWSKSRDRRRRERWLQERS